MIMRAAEAGAGWGCAAVPVVKDTYWNLAGAESDTLQRFNFQGEWEDVETAMQVLNVNVDLQLGLGIWFSLFLTESRGRG